MPTVTSGALSFSNIRDNFVNFTNRDGFNYGTNNANLYNLNYYRGRRYRKAGNEATYFSSGSIAFNAFYNSDGNCACDCACDCACACSTDTTCFPGDSLVVMHDKSLKRIDEIVVGDRVYGGFGYINTVIALHEGPLNTNELFIINNTHKTTPEHRHWTNKGWAALSVSKATTDYTTVVTIDSDGNKGERTNKRFKNTPVSLLEVGMSFVTENGEEEIFSIEKDVTADSSMPVYTLILDGSHTHLVDNKVVTGWAHDEDFNYETWQPI